MMSPIPTVLMLLASCAPTSAQDAGPFAQRGYYITFMRMPTYNLADWGCIPVPAPGPSP